LSKKENNGALFPNSSYQLNPLKAQLTNQPPIDIIIGNSCRISSVFPAPVIFYYTKLAVWLAHGSSKLCVRMCMKYRI